MLDLVLEHSKSVKRQLGKQDVRKFDEYLASVRAVEQRVERSQRWLDTPKPKVDVDKLALASGPDGPEEYISDDAAVSQVGAQPRRAASLCCLCCCGQHCAGD